MAKKLKKFKVYIHRTTTEYAIAEIEAFNKDEVEETFYHEYLNENELDWEDSKADDNGIEVIDKIEEIH